MITAYLRESSRSDKKYMVTIIDPKYNTQKTVHFGAKGYSDYTIHKDRERMGRYDKRHKVRENWGKSGIYTAGFWSKWILWSKPSLSEAKKYTSKKFNIKIISGPLSLLSHPVRYPVRYPVRHPVRHPESHPARHPESHLVNIFSNLN